MTNPRTWMWIVAGWLLMFLLSGLCCHGQTRFNLSWNPVGYADFYLVERAVNYIPVSNSTPWSLAGNSNYLAYFIVPDDDSNWTLYASVTGTSLTIDATNQCDFFRVIPNMQLPRPRLTRP